MDITSEILGIAQRYLRRVRPSGNENIMAVCPFHRKPDGTEERTPSFSMSLTKGVYYCHQCHEKGTLRRFFKEMGLDHNTIQLHHGIVLEEAGKHMAPVRDHGHPHAVFNNTAIEDGVLGFFAHDVSPALPQFAPETLAHFDVGWDGWWNRLTFPIRDVKGDLVAISGRAVYPDQKPRYKIYEDEYLCWDMPPRQGWNKRTVLWHMEDVYPVLSNQLAYGGPDDYVVLVEGFKAAMWMWQCGIKNVVALLGSYLSWEQEWMLAALGCPVFLFLDNDGAGWKGQIDAAKRLQPVIRRSAVRVIEYPERLYDEETAQPDDLTPDEVIEQWANAPTYVNWKLSR